MQFNYSYDFSEVFAKMSTGMQVFTIVLSVVLCVITLVAMWKLFEKAGQAGWKCIIPLYNVYTEFKIAFGNGWWFLLLLIPVFNIIFYILFAHNLAKSFGKDIGYTLGLIFLSWIFLLIIAFSSNIQYVGPKGVPSEAASEE